MMADGVLLHTCVATSTNCTCTHCGNQPEHNHIFMFPPDWFVKVDFGTKAGYDLLDEQLLIV